MGLPERDLTSVVAFERPVVPLVTLHGGWRCSTWDLISGDPTNLLSPYSD